MTTGLQADVDSLPAVDVVGVTVKVPYHLELATAALNNTTRSPARPTRTRSSPSSRRSPRMSANA
jgi:hypothetical protein